MPLVHMGNMVRTELERQGKTIAWLAEQLNMQCPNCYRLLRSQSMNTDMLRRVSILLEHDFFADCSRLNISTGKTIVPPTGAEFMQEFVRKYVRPRIELKEEEDSDDVIAHYSFFYKLGFIEFYARTTDNYIGLGLRHVESLPYTPEIYAAALNICNELQKRYECNRYIAFHDEEKGKIYLGIWYDSNEWTMLEQLEDHIMSLFRCVIPLREKVTFLRELLQKNGSMPLDVYLQQNS